MQKDNILNKYLIVIFCMIMLLFIFFKHFQDVYDINIINKKNIFNSVRKNYINHILFSVDTHNFIKNKKLQNMNNQYSYDKLNEYSQLLKKILFIIDECIDNHITTITIDFLSIYDASLMNYSEIREWIKDNNFWELLREYGKKMRIEINFLYSSTLPELLIQKMENFNKENIKNNYNSKIKINILVAFDIYEILQNKINEKIKKNNDEKIHDFINLKILASQIAPPVDIAIIFAKANIPNFLLLNIFSNKIVSLNYYAENINKKIIHLLIKKYTYQIDSFF